MSRPVASFVISLRRPEARRRNAERLAAALPGGEILPAADGRALPEAERAALVRLGSVEPDYPFPLTPGEVGVFLSHRRAWQAIVARGIEVGFVAEDDAVLSADAGPVLATLAEALRGPQVVQLHHGCRPGDAPAAPAGNLPLCRSSPPRLAMLLLAVTGAAAERLLAASEPPFDRPVDALLQMEWRTGVAVVHPERALARSADAELGGSTIQTRRLSLGPAAIRRQIDRFVYRRRIAALSRQNRSPANTRS